MRGMALGAGRIRFSVGVINPTALRRHWIEPISDLERKYAL
jgi:hypothetical protein